MRPATWRLYQTSRGARSSFGRRKGGAGLAKRGQRARLRCRQRRQAMEARTGCVRIVSAGAHVLRCHAGGVPKCPGARRRRAWPALRYDLSQGGKPREAGRQQVGHWAHDRRRPTIGPRRFGQVFGELGGKRSTKCQGTTCGSPVKYPSGKKRRGCSKRTPRGLVVWSTPAERGPICSSCCPQTAIRSTRLQEDSSKLGQRIG